MSYFGPGGSPLTCQAEIENDTTDGVRRCVLDHGHYNGSSPVDWHTDCPDKNTDPEHGHRHDHGSCTTWADHADGARYAGVPAMPAEQEKKPGRTLTDLGEYTASLDIGGARLHARGPARMVAYVIRAMADAFEEEAER